MTFTRQEIETGEFIAKTKTGKDYKIIEYKELLLAHTNKEKDTSSPGPLRYKTGNGEQVTKIDAKTFKINSTGEIIKKVAN